MHIFYVISYLYATTIAILPNSTNSISCLSAISNKLAYKSSVVS